MSNMFKINNKKIEIIIHILYSYTAANHDGNLNKAIKLIKEAKKAGADAAKFQHFNADTIVSDHSFKSFTKQLSHQSKWCL